MAGKNKDTEKSQKIKEDKKIKEGKKSKGQNKKEEAKARLSNAKNEEKKVKKTAKGKNKDDEEDKEEKKKRKKDTAAPKKVMNAYMFFQSSVRDSVVKDNPGLKMGDYAKIMGKMWSEMTDQKKRKYDKMNEADKKR